MDPECCGKARLTGGVITMVCKDIMLKGAVLRVTVWINLHSHKNSHCCFVFVSARSLGLSVNYL